MFLVPIPVHASVVMGGANTASFTNGLVAWWTMDGADINWNTGTTTDKSGMGNTGSLSGMSTTTSPVAGKISGALNFDGSSSVITSTAPALNFSAHSFSQSVWVKVNALSGAALGITGNAASYQSCGYFFGISAANQMGFYANKSGTFFAVSDAAVPTVGIWYHYVMTYDGSNARIYRNGVQVATSNVGSGYPGVCGSNSYYIGNGVQSGWGYFNGSVDDVRVYNRALSAQEIAQLYQGGNAKIAQSSTLTLGSGLVGYWTFDGSKTDWRTNTTQDSSGMSNAGTLVNFSTSSSPVAGKIGQALMFASSTATHVDVSSSANLDNFAQMSWAGWYYQTEQGTSDAVYAEKSSIWRILITNGIPSIAVATTNDGWYSGGGVTLSSSAGSMRAWHHFVFTYDGTRLREYVDGVLQATNATTISGAIAHAAVPMSIGYKDATSVDYFSGKIDDVRIYNRALSAQEIAQLYQLGSAKIAQSNTLTLDSGLLGYWTLDGSKTNWRSNSTQDSSGMGNTGYFTGMSTTTSPVAGKIGGALKFTASNMISMTAPSLNLGPQAFTQSLWVKMSGLSAGNVAFAGNAAAYTGCGYFLGRSGIGNLMFIMNKSGAQASVATIFPVVGTWYHLVGTYDGNKMSFYLNGTLVNSYSPGSGYPAACGSDTYYMGKGIQYASYLSGVLDDVRVYGRALSAQEVMQLYKLGK